MKEGTPFISLLLFIFGTAPSVCMADVLLAEAGNACPSGYTKIRTKFECLAALHILDVDFEGDLDGSSYLGEENAKLWPSGCYYCPDKTKGCINESVWLNLHSTGSANGAARPLCKQADIFSEGGLLFAGDSDIDLWKTSPVSFPGSNNVGVGGATCDDVLEDVEDLLAISKPARIVLVCGENDLAYGTSVGTTFERFQKVITAMVDSGTQIIFFSTKPEPGTTDLHSSYQEYDVRVKSFAQELAAKDAESPAPLVVIDSYDSFLEAGNSASLYQADELHLSSEGYGFWEKWLGVVLDSTEPCTVWKNGVCDHTEYNSNVDVDAASNILAWFVFPSILPAFLTFHLE